MPHHQGALDGLCGPYAVVNAFALCGMGDAGLLFRTACAALARSRWPGALTEGTSLHDLQRMIKRCREAAGGPGPGTGRAAGQVAGPLRVSYPFLLRPPRSNREFWASFDRTLGERPGVRCVIMRLRRPASHWVVARRPGAREAGRGLTFVDTDPRRPLVRRDRGSLHAGFRHKDPGVWIVDRRDLAAFEVGG